MNQVENREEALKELEDLVRLSESTSVCIDEHLARLQRLRFHAFVFLIVAYAALMLFIFEFLDIGLFSSMVSPSKFVRVSVIFLSLLISGFAFYAAYVRYRQSSKVRRDFEIEAGIHEKLASLIDDHFRRVQREGWLTPVAYATFQMRLMRLDRTDRRRPFS